jgi:hypothetical protein
MANSENNQAGSDYYIISRKYYLDWFLEYTEQILPKLTKSMPIKKAGEICAEARIKFEKILPGLPYLGGDQNEATKWIVLAAGWVSFYHPLKARGPKVGEIGRVLYSNYVEQLAKTPESEFQQRGEKRFSESYLSGMKAWTERSEKLFEKDFVIKFVEGVDQEFDYGLDYHFCPCKELFKEQNAAELAPYFCQVDFPEHKLMGTGLVRKKTLAQGDDICDFRFKKGREVVQNWSTEVPKFQPK